MNDRRVTIGDCRSAGYCIKGIRRRCAELGIDFRRAVKEGIPFEELDGIEDHALMRSRERAVKRIEEEEANGRR